jgi:hypothetical protein
VTSRAQYLQELYDCSQRLARTHLELGELLSAEKSAKVNAYYSSDGRTNADKDNSANMSALNITVDIFKVRSEISSLEAQRDYLMCAVQFFDDSPLIG